MIPIPPTTLEAIFGDDGKKKAQDQYEMSQASIMQLIREMAAQQAREAGVSDPKGAATDKVGDEDEWLEAYDEENNAKS